MRAVAGALLLLLVLEADAARGRWRGKGGGRGRAPAAGVAPSPPVGHDFDTVDCPKCMSIVMRLLIAGARGCPAANATVVRSSNVGRASTAYCDTLLPKRRNCVAYSFGLDGTWDFDKAMVSKGCRVLSFDPLCCGGAHRMGPSHDFIPVGLHTYDGLADSDDPARPNTTFPVLSLRTIMTSYEHPHVDVLRLKVSTSHEWKVLKNLVNTGVLSEIRRMQAIPCPPRTPRTPACSYRTARPSAEPSLLAIRQPSCLPPSRAVVLAARGTLACRHMFACDSVRVSFSQSHH